LAGGAHRAREIEVWMLGRRSYARVAIVDGAEGVLRLTRDVVLSERRQGEWIAMSREPGVLGETVVVALLEDGVTHVATVVESRPIVTDGAVRHRLWLRRVDEHDGGASYWERRR
jgi:hypothetical protein